MSIQTNKLPDNPQIEVIKSGKTGLFTNYIYKAIPLAFDESMSYYETLCGLLNYLQNTIIPTVNNNADAVAELQTLYEELRTYVDNYFNGLDVQEEINNKLDQMVADGTLPEIVASYLNSKAIFGFDNVASLKASTNLVNGSFARTLGYFSKNDGGGALYKITNTIDSNNHQETLNNNLYATLIIDETMNLTQFGINYTDNDITNKLNNAIKICTNYNSKLIIPKHTYTLKTLKTKTTENYNYSYFIELLSNTILIGEDKNLSILKISNEMLTYTSVIFSDSTIKNIELNNFTIEQYYETGNNMVTTNRSNLKNCISLYGIVTNLKIKNMIFTNGCGVDVISINNTQSNDIIIKNNIIDYKYVRNINFYDRSIIYVEAHNYLISNNEINGNFETLGGIECHGYNGRCENNIINKCYTGIHIAPNFIDSQKSANIIISSNILNDNSSGIKMWENTNSESTIGSKGIHINNNHIKIGGYVLNQNFWLSVGLHRSESINGIVINEYTSNHNFSDILISNNSIVVEDYSSYRQYVTSGSAYCSGISIAGSNNVKNINIINNYIEGLPGAGISTGSFNTSIIKNSDNIIITNNTILNCGNAAENNIVYQSPISLKYGIINNMIIRNNNIIKTDNSYNSYVSIYNQTNAESLRSNLYCKDNIIYSVIDGQYSITSNNLKNIIIEKGVTADRPINANSGDTYYDTTLNKLIVYNGSVWTNVDGTSL